MADDDQTPEFDLTPFSPEVKEFFEAFSQKLVGVPMYGTETGNGFHGAPFSQELDDVDIAVLGCAYDLGTTFRAGTRFGPRYLRDYSRFVGVFPVGVWPWETDVREDHRIVDLGDLAFAAGYWDSFRDEAYAKAAEVMAAGAGLLSLGGDHFVTYPLAKAVAAEHGPLAIVHFDSHTDDFPSPRHNHGTMFFHGVVEGWIDASRSTHLGIRTPYLHSSGLGYEVLDARWLREHTAAEAAAEVVRRAGDGPAYVTYDIDFVDPAFAPGTGTPCPGGPDSFYARDILFELDKAGLNVVAGDLVEVAPAYDGPGDITSLLGANLACDILTMIGHSRDRHR